MKLEILIVGKQQRFFIIFNTILVFIILLINSYLLKFFQVQNQILYIILISLVSVALYFILSYSSISEIFSLYSKLKDKIQTTMHEINTPVSTIQINTDILSSKLQDEKNIKRLSRINQACDNLFKLYDDMEYYIKKEIDYVDIKSFPLRESIEDLVMQFDDIKQNIKINIDIDNTSITTDQNGFNIVISNLISNAIKHNKTISTINIILTNNILTIQDDGEGIESQHIYNMFDRYYQVNLNQDGFGIGLSIVKEFCDKHKIDIKIDSSTKGTIFKLNLVNIKDKL